MRGAASQGYTNRRLVDSIISIENYANVVLDAVIVAPIDWSKGTAATQIFEQIQASDDAHVDFLTVMGDGRDDEVIFRWANELERQKKVKHVTTVSLGAHNTEAGYTLTQGVTGMSIL